MSIIHLNEDHYNVFFNMHRAEENYVQWLGNAPYSWAVWTKRNGGALGDDTISALPRDRMSRHALINLVSSNSISTEACVLSILAWGGMKRTHGIRLLNTKSQWMPLCEKLRRGDLYRSEAYRHFKEVRDGGMLNGMGPAYFTKLIYFLHPSHNGYIMDQWTASSINILFSPKLISVTSSHYVTDRNTDSTYEAFCLGVEKIANLIDIRADQVEERLFSHGGRIKHPWREYVLMNR